MLSAMNYYERLEIDETASQDEIKRQYKKLSKIYHPDAQTEYSSNENFIYLSEAYNTLSDEDLRKEYDRSFENIQDEDIEVNAHDDIYKQSTNSEEHSFNENNMHQQSANSNEYSSYENETYEQSTNNEDYSFNEEVHTIDFIESVVQLINIYISTIFVLGFTFKQTGVEGNAFQHLFLGDATALIGIIPMFILVYVTYVRTKQMKQVIEMKRENKIIYVEYEGPDKITIFLKQLVKIVIAFKSFEIFILGRI